MKILENEKLSTYTTFKIGGVAKKFYIPETEEEVVDLTKELKDNYRVISGGSNLLIDDTVTYDNVIYLKETNNQIEVRDNGQFYVGCSVRLQKFIKETIQYNYGGMEFLYSVPGMIGGSVAMNAGRGRKTGQCISNYIVYVDTVCNGVKKRYTKEECDFSYRHSIFKNTNIIVLGVLFQMDPTTEEEANARIKERLDFTRNVQDRSGASFGSLFCKCSRMAMEVVKFLHPGNKKGCSFSNKTLNWIVNKGNGTYKEATQLINKAIFINKLFLCKPEIEVVLWTEEDK